MTPCQGCQVYPAIKAVDTARPTKDRFVALCGHCWDQWLKAVGK